MRSSFLAAATVVALALPLTPAAVADPGGRPDLPPAASDTARERAEAALARAEALFEATPAQARRGATREGQDATMVLNELLRARADLAPKDRERAEALLARPTDGDADPYGDGYCEPRDESSDPCVPVPEEKPHCGENVCIHYVATTKDAPPMTDDDGNKVPDHVEDTLARAESVHETYTGSGYLPPDSDGTEGDYPGNPTDRVDIYLADVGAHRLYGYCASDQPQKEDGTWNYWAYCVIDNDFRREQFPANTPDENEQVTLAHEYFHAIQFAYDAFEDPWFMEATATWAEDELFDHINDNWFYLPYGQLKRPRLPLDKSSGLSVYGNWIFFRYLTERWPEAEGGLPILVRELIEQTSGRAGDRDLYSTQAIQAALAKLRTSFTKVYGQFADANRRPGRTYSEGSAYPVAPTLKTWRLTRSRRSTGPRTVELNHLTNVPLRFKPRRLGQRDWRIRVQVDMPPRKTAPVARVAVYLKGGKVRTSAIRLNRKTRGRKVVPFSSRKVKYVELVLVNASRRSKCWRGKTWACQGKPLDNKASTEFKARIFRR